MKRGPSSRLCARCSLEESRPCLRRCQEKKKEEENSENEQEQGRTSQQLVLPAPGGFNEGTPASGMEFDLLRGRCGHGECGGARNSGAANDRKRSLSNSPSRRPTEEDAFLADLRMEIG